MYDELVKSLRETPIDMLCAKVMREAADAIEELSHDYEKLAEDFNGAVELLHKREKPRWIPVTFEDGGSTASIPDEYDGCWILVTDGGNISVERIEKDAYDHFFPLGRWFDLEDVTHWMPLPELPKEETE